MRGKVEKIDRRKQLCSRTIDSVTAVKYIRDLPLVLVFSQCVASVSILVRYQLCCMGSKSWPWSKWCRHGNCPYT